MLTAIDRASESAMDSWQPACLCFQLGRPRTIGRLQCVQISLDALLDLLLTLVDLTRRDASGRQFDQLANGRTPSISDGISPL